MTTVTKFVAVAQGDESTGSVVYWKASQIDRAALVNAWRAAGLDMSLLPAAATTSEAALSKAVKATADKRLLARPMQDGKWAMIAETNNGGSLAHKQALSVEASLNGPLLFTHGDCDMSTYTTLCMAIEREYREALAVHDASAVGLWLTRTVASLNGVTLRDRGGVYFVPRIAHSLETLRKMTAVVRSVAEVLVYEIPAMRADQAADAILAAIEEEAMNEADDIEAYLIKNSEPGTRSLRVRRETLDATKAKVARYEALFGKRMSAVMDRLTTIRNKLSGSFVIDAASDGRAATEAASRGLMDLEERPASAFVWAPTTERKLEID